MASEGNKLAENIANGASVALIAVMRDAVKSLIKKAVDLKSQVNKLQKENEELKTKLQEKENEVTTLSQQLENYKLGLTLRGATAEETGYTRKEAKKKIGQMVREINECIALLKQ